MLDPQFVRLTRCLVTGSPLSLAAEELLDRVNAAIAAGTLRNSGGDVVDEPLDAGLLNDQQTLIYPVRDDIVSLVRDEAIPLTQLRPT